MDYTAQGHTVGLAQRMEQLADSGRVCVSAHTARLVEGYFELLEEMYEKRHAQLVFLRIPPYHRLRSDPRYDDLLRRIGFPES